MTNAQSHIEQQEIARVSSQEIDHAILLLQNAFFDGRLDAHDLDKRMAQVVNVKTHTDLTKLVNDLPTLNVIVRRLKHTIMAFASGIEQKGRFWVPSHLRVISVMGGCVVDLSQARFESLITDIHVTAVMGGVEILLPRGVRVEVDGSAIFGGFDQNIVEENLPSYAPTIHIHGSAFMGGAEIRYKNPTI